MNLSPWYTTVSFPLSPVVIDLTDLLRVKEKEELKNGSIKKKRTHTYTRPYRSLHCSSCTSDRNTPKVRLRKWQPDPFYTCSLHTIKIPQSASFIGATSEPRRAGMAQNWESFSSSPSHATHCPSFFRCNGRITHRSGCRNRACTVAPRTHTAHTHTLTHKHTKTVAIRMVHYDASSRT